MRLALVRHGETLWNAEHRLQGQRDVGLSTHGIGQALDLAPLVRDLHADAVVVSPLARARETADALGCENYSLDDGWMEANLGDWTGRSASELIEAGEPYAEWRAGAFTPPGAESFSELRERASAAVARLPKAETVLVVTHGGTIRAVLDHLIGLSPSVLVPAAPASLTVLDLDGRPRLHSYGVTMRAAQLVVPD